MLLRLTGRRLPAALACVARLMMLPLRLFDLLLSGLRTFCQCSLAALMPLRFTFILNIGAAPARNFLRRVVNVLVLRNTVRFYLPPERRGFLSPCVSLLVCTASAEQQSSFPPASRPGRLHFPPVQKLILSHQLFPAQSGQPGTPWCREMCLTL